MAATGPQNKMAATHYERLGLARTATASEVREAYRRLARKLHPDKSPSTTEEFQQINEGEHARDARASEDREPAWLEATWDRRRDRHGRGGDGTGRERAEGGKGRWSLRVSE